MKRGDLVSWKFQVMDLPNEIGIILNYIPFENRGNDPFPHWSVLFGDRGILHCRESDLEIIR